MSDEATVIDDTTTTDTETTTASETTDNASTTDAATDDGATTDDWRSRLAGDDEKLLGFLGRYQSEKAFVEAAKKDRDAVRSKQTLKLPDNPTETELAEYRKEHGIPETAEGYYEKLADGLVVGDDDKPFVDKFMAEMHGAHAPPAMVNAALDAYYGIVEEQAEQQAQAARELEQASVEELREEWGQDYKRNLNIVTGFLDGLPETVADVFRNGKDSGGLPLGNNAAVIRWLTGLALEQNPIATVVPGAGANQASAIADELAEIRKVMANDRARYNKDEAMQARYRELLGAELKLKGQ